MMPFGNRTSQTVTKGSGPVSSLGVNPANNRVTGWGYDANGNTTSQPGAFTSLGYDVDNRLVSAVLAGGGSESYGYGPDNKRVWRTKATGQAEVYFHGVGGQLQGVYKWDTVNANGDIGFYVVGLEPVIPKGLQMNRDRLGSVLYSGGARYYPYGEESPVTGQDRDKFATYRRDGATALDYADQRYYAQTAGRFLTADPYLASGGAAEPGSWNRYAYVGGDPVNHYDPEGLRRCGLTYRGSIYTMTCEFTDSIWHRLSGGVSGDKAALQDGESEATEIYGKWSWNPRLAITAARELRRQMDESLTDCGALFHFGLQAFRNTDSADSFISSFGVFLSQAQGGVVASHAAGMQVAAVAHNDRVLFTIGAGKPSGYNGLLVDGDWASAETDQAHHFSFFLQLGYLALRRNLTDPFIGGCFAKWL